MVGPRSFERGAPLGDTACPWPTHPRSTSLGKAPNPGTCARVSAGPGTSREASPRRALHGFRPRYILHRLKSVASSAKVERPSPLPLPENGAAHRRRERAARVQWVQAGQPIRLPLPRRGGSRSSLLRMRRRVGDRDRARAPRGRGPASPEGDWSRHGLERSLRDGSERDLERAVATEEAIACSHADGTGDQQVDCPRRESLRHGACMK